MHHGVADLDTGGPAVEQNSARFEFQHRQQLAGVVVVAFVGVHGRGQLAFDVLGDGAHLGGVGAADDQTGRAEDLGLQGLGLEEAGRVGGEQGCAAGCFAVASLSADDQVGLGAERVDTVSIVLCDAGGEHRRGRRLRDSVASRGEEAVKTGPVDGDHQAGISAELARSHRERCDERAAEVGAVGGQGAVEQEHRVDGAHLGVDRDGLGAGRRAGDESRSRSAGPGEADRLDSPVGYEGDSEFGPRLEEQGEGTRRQPRIGDRFGDRAADQFRGAGMGVVRLDYDGTSGGQGRRGIAAGYGEGQREVAGAEDGDGAQRDGALANVGAWQGFRSGSAGSIRALFQLPSPRTSANRRSWPRGTADLAGDAGLRESGFRDGASDDVVDR